MTPKSAQANRAKLLKNLLQSRILVLDGAMGTSIQNFNLKAEDFGGDEYEGCNEYLVITKPSVIESIHASYLKAGCDIIETNTFGGTPLVLDEYGLGAQAFKINQVAAELARKVADQYSTPDKPRFVAGSIGPTTKAISVTGGITFEELIANFKAQTEALIAGGVDYLLLETCQDTRNIKAGLIGIDQAQEKCGTDLPIAISGTIEPMGTMLAGQSIESLYTSVEHRDLLYIGLNCATGPEFMTDPIRSLAQVSRFPVACLPNAGLPDENGHYLETPQMLSNVLSRFTQSGWVNLLGGCCGTQPEHIAALVVLAEKATPRTQFGVQKSTLSGVDFLEITDEMRPVIVGERTNVIGSKKFKTLIYENKFEEAAELARTQMKNGAQIIDVCLANPDRNEFDDMKRFFEIAIKSVRAPFMIDSTDENVIAMALTYCQGKSIINSINLEDGEERFEKVVPLAKRFGAALVVGTIDDDKLQGMGVSRQRKLEIAEREYDLLTKKYGVAPEDIYWDPLVFPCATGDEQYKGSAVETIEGLRLIKQKCPKTRSVLGISNVSFGLPQAGREVLNSVFLYHCVQAGLDLAIVNSEKLVRYAAISAEEKKLSEDLLFSRTPDPVAAFAAHFRTKKVEIIQKAKLPLQERLSAAIVEGTKDGLIADLDEAMKEKSPLEIINGPLMKGMDEVGRLFNTNQLIVAEVLQSAEVMKTAVTHLEQFMEKKDTSSLGKMVLATVKGDVHDIGKNLVDIIFSNNGIKVINLGIKIPPEQLIAAIREHKPDLVGLSGLLVKSAQQMVITAGDLTKTNITVPIICGGAALSQNFVDRQISVAYKDGTVTYAKDAMHGLEIAKSLLHPEKKQGVIRDIKLRQESLLNAHHAAMAKASLTPAPVLSTERSPQVRILTDGEIVKAPDLDRHVLKNTPIEILYKYINPLMLFGRHLGVPGALARQLDKLNDDPLLRKHVEREDPKSFSIWKAVEDVKKNHSSVLIPSAVYRYFNASSDGHTKLKVFDSGKNNVPVEFEFPRQPSVNGLCIADYIKPASVADRALPYDNLAFFVVSVGKGIRKEAEYLKEKGEYLKSHVLQALALETAEAYAEYLHQQIRRTWGFPDPQDMTMMQRFQAKYRGKRYSFGYPACPRLEDQSALFSLLNPEDIGVYLTEGFMMEPEASVSAIVFQHPDATYFSVGQAGATEQREA